MEIQKFKPQMKGRPPSHLMIKLNPPAAQKADLPILCHRHTTSKLKEYEDLETIGTLGFRGEALCSISFVSHMTVTTMTGDEPHGWRVTYKVRMRGGDLGLCVLTLLNCLFELWVSLMSLDEISVNPPPFPRSFLSPPLTHTRPSLTPQDSEMDPSGPKPVASVRGTTILAEDMFYNVPTRRKVCRGCEEGVVQIMGGTDL